MPQGHLFVAQSINSLANFLFAKILHLKMKITSYQFPYPAKICVMIYIAIGYFFGFKHFRFSRRDSVVSEDESIFAKLKKYSAAIKNLFGK